ncbi:MAG: M20/M25/M40 family metallo-hydrolase [Caldilineaceae bacterium]|nr:M20/M25/M40 family metallo-hydrolase [Caldilineaceae bacterium]
MLDSTRTHNVLDQSGAIDLLHGLVEIPSFSRQEAAASTWLTQRMDTLGYDRAYVDGAGNAVGEIGPAHAAKTIVLLGHIDTVPGNIPVRIEDTDNGPVLYGRGSVDAKGPLATFTAAVARIGTEWAHNHDIRFVVVGAVEEEAATSKGARFIAARFNGKDEPLPEACIIGEPSSWSRVTLGYKGRLLVEIEARQPMAHTAGPERGVATLAVDFWNHLAAYADSFNDGRERAFDQLLPSLRDLRTWTDDAMHDHVYARAGVRLPVDFDADAFARNLANWAATAAAHVGAPREIPAILPAQPVTLRFAGPLNEIQLTLLGHEPAWRSDRNNALVRAFLAALRGHGQRPAFVVKTGTSDMNVVGPVWGCPILAYGPGDSSLDHTPHEHVQIAEYWNAVLVLEAALREL